MERREPPARLLAWWMQHQRTSTASLSSSSDSDHNGDVERGGMRANGYVMHRKERSSRAFTRDELEAAADPVDKVRYH